MHEWKKHAWNEDTWQWLKPYLGSAAREATTLRNGDPGETTVPLRNLLWRYNGEELGVGSKELPFSAVMPPQFAARAILEAQGLDDSAEAADEALSTPEGITSLFNEAKARRWTVLAHCFLPVGGEVLSGIITWLTADLEGKYSRTQAKINLNLLGSNRTLNGRDLELIEDTIAAIPREPGSKNNFYGKKAADCSYEECKNHFTVVNDPTRKLESVRGAKQALFAQALHCENCDPPAWNITRYGVLLDDILDSEERQVDGRYAAIARILLPFMGYRFAYMEETFTRDTPGEWLVELLTPSDEEIGAEFNAFSSALKVKYGIQETPRNLFLTSGGGELPNSTIGNFAAKTIAPNSPSPLVSPIYQVPKRGIV